ncbi:hypothetical protein BC940DRAFT_332270 [Gongronella butleri]|nr:hypothetical protein BC940DRAFT_332270 [Gongronella butleri]
MPGPPPVIEDEEEKHAPDAIGDEKSVQSSSDSSQVDHGVKTAQAANQVWSKSHLIAAYIMIWLVQFVLAFSGGIAGVLTPYVTSEFEQHSLTATTTILSSLVAGLIVLPYAKLINVWGRPQGFALMVCSTTLGLVMMAACNDVQTYCAAQVFYHVGTSTVQFTMTIFIADTSSLRNRALIIAFEGSPWLASVWAYGPAAQRILDTIGFRWGFGIWAMVIPIVCSPLFGLFYYNQLKAQKMGLVPEKEKHNRTLGQSIIYYLKEFDVAGLFLICAGLAMFLLSFSLYSYQPDQWRSPLVICLIVIGGLLVVAFALYEKFIAPVTFIPWNLMTDRTVFSTYTMVASIYTAWYIWNNYFYSFLIVVNNLSVADATYITNIYTIGSTFWALVVGVVIRYNGRLKWLALYFGVPLSALGVGLMINFRQPDVNIGFIAMCQIFIAFGGGTLVICEQMTVMAVSKHQFVSAVLSMENMIASIGGAVGSAIASAMWSGIFPQKLAEFLPASAQGDLASIYGSLTVQSSYPVGSPERNGINEAYSATQRYMLIAATCLYVITFVSVMFWKDIDVRHLKKTKGNIF